MKAEKFLGVISDIDDKFILEAENYRPASKKQIIYKISAAAACFIILFAGLDFFIKGFGAKSSGENGNMMDNTIENATSQTTGESLSEYESAVAKSLQKEQGDVFVVFAFDLSEGSGGYEEKINISVLEKDFEDTDIVLGEKYYVKRDLNTGKVIGIYENIQ